MRALTFFCMVLLLLPGCSESELQATAIPVSARDFAFEVHSRGELISTESIPIHVPNTVNMIFNILWMIPEYSQVREGDVIARFDGSDIETQRGANLVQMAQHSMMLSNHELRSEGVRSRISHNTIRVEGESEIARNFEDVDPKFFSKNELIDAVGDLTYLLVEEAFYEWQAQTHDKRTEAETTHIVAQQQAVDMMLQKNTAALEVMELKSPSDGVFVYARTPWGQKLSRGQPVFAGRPVGMLPINGKVAARLFVPEVDAISIAVGQTVVLQLDSAVTREIRGHITTISSVATAIDRRDPKKYFTVEATLDEIDPDLMRIGSNLSATIVTDHGYNAILLPKQAVFFENDRPFVYVLKRGVPTPVEVDIGSSSPTLVEIKSGLTEGDMVSLYQPVNETA